LHIERSDTFNVRKHKALSLIVRRIHHILRVVDYRRTLVRNIVSIIGRGTPHLIINVASFMSFIKLGWVPSQVTIMETIRAVVLRLLGIFLG
jgi:hypothetical protein